MPTLKLLLWLPAGIATQEGCLEDTYEIVGEDKAVKQVNCEFLQITVLLYYFYEKHKMFGYLIQN